MNKLDCPLICAKQIKMENEEHMDRIYKKVIADKGEGIMLKDLNLLMKGKRSNYIFSNTNQHLMLRPLS